MYNNVNLNISIVCSFFVDFHLNDSFILKNFNTQNNSFFPFYVKLVFNSFLYEYWMCIYTYICIHIHTYISHARPHIHAYVSRNCHTYIYVSTYMHARARIYSRRFNVSILMIYYNNSNNNRYRYGGGNDDYKTLTTKIIKLSSFFYFFFSYNII